MEITGKVALVTGGANGIGFETCKELLRAGVKEVTVCDLNIDAGKMAVDELCKQFGDGRASFIKTDVTNASEFEEAFKKTVKENGGLDIVVNNAGISNEKQWELEININLLAVVRGTLLGLQYMGKDKGGNGGVIINMASICGIHAIEPLPMYTAAKHGVVALSRSLGGDFHYKTTGVRIVAMCPSITSTVLYTGTKNNTYDEKWASEWNRICATLTEQGPEYVGRGVVELAMSAPSGTVWVSEAKKPIYQVKIEVKEIH